jgi:putative DNA primase/helicase
MNDDLLYYENGMYQSDFGLTKLHNEYVVFFDELLSESKRLPPKSPHYKILEKLGNEGQRDFQALKINTKKLCKVVNDTEFNTERNLINLKNGLFDLDKNELVPYSPSHLFTFRMNASFSPESTCPLWQTFLNETFENSSSLIKFVQKSVGYAISGFTNEKKVWICHGRGDTGKTTFIETLQYLLGNFSRALNPKTLEKGTEKSWELAEIIGKRLLTISETDESFVFSNIVKALSGNTSRLSVEGKYKKPIEITPFVKIFIDTNNKPLLTDGDRGSFLKRLTFIPFLHIVPDNKKDEIC